MGDDGSTDDTAAVMRDLAIRSRFPVHYVRADAHVGKTRIDNEIIARARSELALWCDSDDALTPEAIQRLLEAWRAIPAHDRTRYGGLTALAATAEQTIVNPFATIGSADVSWNDLAARYRVIGDMVYVTRTALLQQYPFPEVDLVIPESAVWNLIGNHPTKVVPDVLKIVEYQRDGGISFNGRMTYNRGRAYSAAITYRALRGYRSGLRDRSWRLINFLRYARHGELTLRDAWALWKGNSPAAAFWAAVPLARLLAARDVAQGKVVRTHREFLANRDAAVTATWLNEGSSA